MADVQYRSMLSLTYFFASRFSSFLLIQQNAGTVKWSDVRQLGRYCPQLEVLKLRGIIVGDDISAQDPEESSKEVSVLPRLRVCVIERQEDMAYNLALAQFIIGRLLHGNHGQTTLLTLTGVPPAVNV